MAKTRAIIIDGKKLRRLVTERAGSVSAGAKKCGYSENGFDHSLKTETMSESMSLLIDRILGIPIEDYRRTVPVEPVKSKPQERTLTDADFEAIRQIIKEEVTKVWN